MTYGKIFQLGARTADQCRAGINKGIRVCHQGGCGAGSPIRDLDASSLSLYARSRSAWKAGTDSRGKDCFYGQVIAEADPETSATSKIYRADLKRDSYKGLGSFSPQGSAGWLRQRSERFRWNTVLTDWESARLSRPINFWYQTGVGQQVR
jgi:hypothetical protein